MPGMFGIFFDVAAAAKVFVAIHSLETPNSDVRHNTGVRPMIRNPLTGSDGMKAQKEIFLPQKSSVIGGLPAELQ